MADELANTYELAPLDDEEAVDAPEDNSGTADPAPALTPEDREAQKLSALAAIGWPRLVRQPLKRKYVRCCTVPGVFVWRLRAVRGSLHGRMSEWFHLCDSRGHVALSLCVADGTLQRRIATKGRHKGVYRLARKVRWGDTWPHAIDPLIMDQRGRSVVDDVLEEGRDDSGKGLQLRRKQVAKEIIYSDV